MGGWFLLFAGVVWLARFTARRLSGRRRLDDIIGREAIQIVVAAGIFIALVADDYGPIGDAVLVLSALVLVSSWISTTHFHLRIGRRR